MFALSLAATRLVLAAAHAANTRLTDILRLRITRACLTSAALFAVSCVVPEPFRYLLWRLEEPLGPHGYMWLLAAGSSAAPC